MIGKKIIVGLCFLFIFLGHLAYTQTIDVQQEKTGNYKINISDPYHIHAITTKAPSFVVGERDIDIETTLLDSNGAVMNMNGVVELIVNDKPTYVKFSKGKAKLRLYVAKDEYILIQNTTKTISKQVEIRHIAGWLSLLPPFIAIVFALIFREVISSLFLGIFAGVLITQELSFSVFFSGLMTVMDKYVLQALFDTDHLSVILFSMTIGAMVAIISKNGGMAGIVEKLSKYAKSAKSTQLITFFLGIAIFFDDYANTLVVGNTMRPVTDKFKISREKLAYIVDSTAAPVACLSFITTWIGAELGYIKDAITQTTIQEGAYSIFLSSLQYAYYPVFTLFLMLLLIKNGKDFGAMLHAEKRARATGILNENVATENTDEFVAKEGVKKNWLNAFLPILLLVVVTLLGLIHTGLAESGDKLVELGKKIDTTSWTAVWQNLDALNEGNSVSTFKKMASVIGNANPYSSLVWGSLSGVLLALLLSISQRLISLSEGMEAIISGYKAMVPAVMILSLAWGLSKVTEDVGTADYLTKLFAGTISPYSIPAVTFIMAAIVAFSTGSSWGTMAILYPLILPATWQVCKAAGMSEAETMEIIYHATAVILSGSVLGDHCSPISDTTILSSLSSGCNHLAHVKTQMPYALTICGISIVISLLAGLGLPFYVNYAVGFVAIFAIVKWVAKPIE